MGNNYDIKSLDSGKLALVNTKTGRVVFELHLCEVDVSIEPENFTKASAVFYCFEPEK
jgi:hypothetical protein